MDDIVGIDGNVFYKGKKLTPTDSLKLRNHSPTGFAWGYGGSGPSQLALAILLAVTEDADISLRHYMAYKQEVVSELPESFNLSINSVEEFLEERGE